MKSGKRVRGYDQHGETLININLFSRFIEDNARDNSQECQEPFI